MYCKQCGKELRDDEMFCSSCGTKAGEVKKTTFEMPDAERLKNSVDVFKSRLNDLGENKVTYLTGICLLLVSAFLLTKEMFAVSYTVFYTNSYTYTMFENKEVLGTLFVVAYLAAVVTMLVPLLLNKEWKRNDFTLGKYVPVASLLWLLIVILAVYDEVAGELNEYKILLDAVDLKVKLTSNAWVLIIIWIVTFCLVGSVAKKLTPENLEETETVVVSREENEVCADNVGD